MSKSISVKVSDEQKEQWTKALADSQYHSMAEFIRDTMDQVSAMLLSAGTDNELEIVFMLQPRSDGKTTIKGDGYLVGAKMDYV